MKTFSEVELHYRYLAQDYPTNVHFCQLHNTLLAYAPDLDGMIKTVRDHIVLKEQEAKKYSSDTFFVVECYQHIEADKEFLEFCEVSIEKNDELEQDLLFLRSEEHQSSVMFRYDITPKENGYFVDSGNGLTRTMTTDEIIEEANMYKVALQRRKERKNHDK